MESVAVTNGSGSFFEPAQWFNYDTRKPPACNKSQDNAEQSNCDRGL